jgi:hypothetical protein
MLFPSWESFYVIVGSSAGALTGLMFVVVALVFDFGGTSDSLGAFGTPTVVHFSAPLLLSILMTVPWPAMLAVRIATAAFGAAGMVYMILVLRRARAQTGYEPVFEDWLFHNVLPMVAYGASFVAAFFVNGGKSPSLFVIGGAAVLLMFVGVHNAWDTVTYIVTTRWERIEKQKAGKSKDAG